MLEMARDALRTIALGVRTYLESGNLHDYTGASRKGHEVLTDPANFAKVEMDMTFVGMVGIIEPPRPECKMAIEQCRVAGVSVIMVTGDDKIIAEATARDLGILRSLDSSTKKLFTGKEFDDLPEEEKTQMLRRIMLERGL